MAKWTQLPTLKRAASILWPEWGSWAYSTWERWNEECFGGELKPCGILFGLTPHGHAVAYFNPADVTITLHSSVTDPRTRDPWGAGAVLGEVYAADVVLHEMIHQHIAQNYDEADNPKGTSSHNCRAWVTEVNRISKILGFKREAEVVRQRRVNGKVKWAARKDDGLTMRELAGFPHLLRPKGYYGRRRRAHPVEREPAAR